MQDPGRHVYTPGQVRELDRAAISELAIPGYTLMSRAGQAVFDVTGHHYPRVQRWLVICGSGNNAGDGYVVARLAMASGARVTAASLSDPGGLSGDAARAWRDFQAAGGSAVSFDRRLCDDADVIIDAIFGTGLARPAQGAYLDAILAVNAAGRPVVAVDIPSGLNAATGQVMGEAIDADHTVTFVGRKIGLYVGSGPDCTGRIAYADLDVPEQAFARVQPVANLFGDADLAGMLPRRPRTSHKGEFGHVLIIGGNHGMGGAVQLSGEAALRAGAGLVTVATRPENMVAVTGYRPELMCKGIETAADLDPLLSRATVIAIGPGLGQDAWAAELLGRALAATQFKVVDADALNLLAGKPRRDEKWILTPHPGEAGRLLGVKTSEVQADRLTAVRQLAAKYGGATLLKGRCTLVTREATTPFIIDGGNPGMATAGMGDVLTGLIAGVMAQRPDRDLAEVGAAAAFIHARAGEAAAVAGERGIIAGDVLLQLRPWLNPST